MIVGGHIVDELGHHGYAAVCGAKVVRTPEGQDEPKVCKLCVKARGLVGPCSASQFDKWRQCQHRWGLVYLEDVREPSGPGARRGVAMHEALEAYFKGEPWEELPHADLAKKGMHLLPEPSDELGVEVPFDVVWGGVLWVGRIDLTRIVFDVDVEPPSDLEQRLDAVLDPELPTVWDHKSTSDIKWAKRPEELRTDVQAAVYAAWAMAQAHVDEAELQWTYMPSPKSQKAVAVKLRLMHDEVEAVLDVASAEVRKMHAAREAQLKAEDLPRNWNACSAYGGCPHRARCGPPPDGGIGAAFAQDEERAHRAQKDEPMGSLLSRLTTAKADPINPPESAERRAEVAAGKQGPAPAPAAKKGGMLHRLETRSSTLTDDERDPALKFPLDDEPAATSTLDDEPAATSTPAAETVLEEQPSGVFDTTPPAAAVEPPKAAPAPATRVERAGVRAAAAAPTATEPKRQGFVLYVDCRPTRGGGIVLDAEDLVEPAHDAVRKQYGVDDYRLVDFGKGPGAYAAALRKLMEVRPIGEGAAVALTTKTREGQDALAVLERFAGTVVRGMP